MGRQRARRWIAAVPAIAFLFMAAGCSAASSAGAPQAAPTLAPGFGGGAADAAPADGGAAPEAGASPEGGSLPAGGPAPLEERKIIRVASIDLVVTDVLQTASSLRSVALAMGGYVSGESLSIAEDPAEAQLGYSTVVVSVPSSRLDKALADISALGTVRQRSIESTDVTDAVVDTESRIKTMRASIARLQTLMSKAGSVRDISDVESELTQRESELEALLGRLTALNRQVDLSPITVTLRTAEAAIEEPVPPNGFLAGLQAGWASFTGMVQVALTVIGVLLPYLVLLALVGVPLLWWRRHRRAVSVVSAAVVPAVPEAPEAPSEPTQPQQP